MGRPTVLWGVAVAAAAEYYLFAAGGIVDVRRCCWQPSVDRTTAVVPLKAEYY